MRYLLILLLNSSLLFSQQRFIKGYVYFDEDLIPIPEVMIFDNNNRLITETNSEGYFTFKLDDSNKVFFTDYPGLQKETVNIIDNSDVTYIFLMSDQNIDFVSLKKARRMINRDRRKFLKKIYPEAIRRGIIPKNTLFNKQNIVIE